jgi:hypothetical protein
MKMDEFLQQHAVFTVEELDRFLSARGSGNPNTRRSLLTYYRKKGRIIPIRRGCMRRCRRVAIRDRARSTPIWWRPS